MLTAIATLTAMNIIGSYIMIRKKHNFDSEAFDDHFDGKISNIIKAFCMAPFVEECLITLAVPMILRDLGIYHDSLICMLFGIAHIQNGFFILNRIDLGFQVINTTLMRYVIIGHHFYACVFLHYYFNMMGVVWVLVWNHFLPIPEPNKDKDTPEDTSDEEGVDIIFRQRISLPERSRSVGDMDGYDTFGFEHGRTTENKQAIELHNRMSHQLDMIPRHKTPIIFNLID